MAALPCESAALQVTVVFPSGKVVPETGEQLTATGPSTRSVAEGSAYVTTAPAEEVASAVSSAWAAITGPALSTTCTTKRMGAATLPCASVALQVTVVLPIANGVAEAGEQAATPAPSTAS